MVVYVLLTQEGDLRGIFRGVADAMAAWEEGAREPVFWRTLPMRQRPRSAWVTAPEAAIVEEHEVCERQ
jgi:hypothetical protein